MKLADFTTNEIKIDPITGIRWQRLESPSRLVRLAAVGYALPIATATVLGGIKVDGSSGPITVDPVTGKAVVDAYSKSETAGAINSAVAPVTTAAAAAQTTATAAADAASNAATLAGQKIASTEKGAASGVASLGADGLLPAGQSRPSVLDYDPATKVLTLTDATGAVSTRDLSGLAVDVTVQGATLTAGVLTLSQTNGGAPVTVDLSSFKAVNVTGSLEGDGATDNLKLVGDQVAPGAGKFYGTDSSGAKGWINVRTPETFYGTPTPTIPSGKTVMVGDFWNSNGTIFIATSDDSGATIYWQQFT